MADTLIKVDLTQPAPSNPLVHNRWHPDIPIAVWVKPGDDFILETYDWTGGYIKNNDSADDVHLAVPCQGTTRTTSCGPTGRGGRCRCQPRAALRWPWAFEFASFRRIQSTSLPPTSR